MSKYIREELRNNSLLKPNPPVKFKTYFRNCIYETLCQRQYLQTQNQDWNLYWLEKDVVGENLDRIRSNPNKRVNHFRNFFEICRKDLLCKNIKKYRKNLQKQGNFQEATNYNFIPLTYNLPSDYSVFCEEFRRVKQKEKGNTIWIMKPIGKSQGIGIFLFRNLNEIFQWGQKQVNVEPYIVQRYIDNPLLIGHKKFDLRIYALVTNHNPLTVYLYRSGFARFTHSSYSNENLRDLSNHLTNVAIQKNSDNYSQDKGGKYQLAKFKLYLLSLFPQKAQKCFDDIESVVLKTLKTTQKLIVYDSRCFQLYGFDIMIDNQLKVWLIEVNGSPSMTANTQKDNILKKGLIDDVLTIVDIQNILNGNQKQIGGFDIICKDNIKSQKQHSLLGCLNNRNQQMKQLAKQICIRLSSNPESKEQRKVRIKSQFNQLALLKVKRSNNKSQSKSKQKENLKLPKIQSKYQSVNKNSSIIQVKNNLISFKSSQPKRLFL